MKNLSTFFKYGIIRRPRGTNKPLLVQILKTNSSTFNPQAKFCQMDLDKQLGLPKKVNITEAKVHVYKEDENKVIGIITNQLDWQARTVADLDKNDRI